MEKQRKLVRRSELAKQLGVHPDTIERWSKAGKHGLRWVKLGKLVYIDTADFNPNEPHGNKDEYDIDKVEALFSFAVDGVKQAFEKLQAEKRQGSKGFMIGECIRRLQLYGEHIIWRCSQIL